MSAIPFVHGESEHESLNVGGRSFIQPHIDTLLNETKYHDRRHACEQQPQRDRRDWLEGKPYREEAGDGVFGHAG